MEATDDSTPLPEQLEEKEKQLNIEKSKLDAEQQQYQHYLAKKANWQKDKNAIVGASDRFDTLEFYKHELSYLEKGLNNELEAKYEERRGIVRVVFDKKQEVISIYKDARSRLNY